ncbi:hypothetical protein IAR55_004870 [Kwoniella newhampshirensis]|uniref:Uncharacterized protein n=1 Tax=Kwoniella newhampshirensis TaxID=1651941 RepID=A0AAW0YWF0_9TREE
MSLHTVVRHDTTLKFTDAQNKVIERLVGEHGTTGRLGTGSWFGGTTEDEGSFWTARGTLRSVIASQLKEGTETREMIEEQEVLVLVHETFKPKKSSHPIFVSEEDDDVAESEDSQWTYGETPFPSRVLYLFHTPPGPRSAPMFTGAINVDPWSWLEKGREQMEKAFWGLIMPSVSGLMGVGQFLGTTVPTLMTLIPANATLTITSNEMGSRLIRDTSSSLSVQKTPRLYAQETIYTLRLPVQEQRERWRDRPRSYDAPCVCQETCGHAQLVRAR